MADDYISFVDNGWGIGSGKFTPEPVTVYINDCDHIKLTAKGIDFSVEIEPEKLNKVGEIIINGIKFVKAGVDNG